MPELPEVETVVRDLRKKIVGHKIERVWTDWPKLIKDLEKQDRINVSEKAVAHFTREVIGKKIERVERRAKNILIYLSDDHLILVHQKMTGHFLVGRWEIEKDKAVPVSPKEIVDDPYNRHVHLILYLSGGKQLGLSDVRKFAKVLFGTRSQIENLPELKELGLDALSPALGLVQFARIVLAHRRKIKQVLMDPKVIAGIGNIYSDDILWRARVHPARPANSLTSKEVKDVYKAMREVLTKAVKLRGTSTSDFRDTAGKEGGYTEHRLVYQRKGQPCVRCKALIERMVVGGRSAHFCSNCQKS